MIEVDW